MSFETIRSDFTSQGVRCGGVLYRPKDADKPPVVIMAHGFAAEKTFRLPAYAERFVEEGMAAYLFDYRCFGDSDGEPRNLVHPFRHVEDWKAAVAHVRALPELDGARLALWGSSFSGGHVVVVAAQDPDIAGIVSQVPFVDARAAAGAMGAAKLLRASLAGFRDLFRAATFRRPYYVPVVGDPDTFAVMNTPESKPGYLGMIPEGSAWKNECPARILLIFGMYRPITYAHKITCPVLIMAGEEDSLIPIEAVERMAAQIPRARLVKLPIGHFDIYVGDDFEKAVKEQGAFLKEVLGIA